MGERIPAYWCVRDSANPLSWKIYEIYMLVIVLILPSTIMVITYGTICQEIWKMTLQRGALTKSVPSLWTVSETPKTLPCSNALMSVKTMIKVTELVALLPGFYCTHLQVNSCKLSLIQLKLGLYSIALATGIDQPKIVLKIKCTDWSLSISRRTFCLILTKLGWLDIWITLNCFLSPEIIELKCLKNRLCSRLSK